MFHKKFRSLVNDLLQKLEISDVTCIDSYATRYTSDQYEGGAYKLMAVLESSSKTIMTMGCSYSLKELSYYLNSGYRLVLEPIRNVGYRTGILNAYEIGVVK